MRLASTSLFTAEAGWVQPLATTPVLDFIRILQPAGEHGTCSRDRWRRTSILDKPLLAHWLSRSARHLRKQPACPRGSAHRSAVAPYPVPYIQGGEAKDQMRPRARQLGPVVEATCPAVEPYLAAEAVPRQSSPRELGSPTTARYPAGSPKTCPQGNTRPGSPYASRQAAGRRSNRSAWMTCRRSTWVPGPTG